MPRVGQVKPVDEVLEATGRVEKRHRLLPARVMVYFTLAMCLWADEGYEEVARSWSGALGRWPGGGGRGRCRRRVR